MCPEMIHKDSGLVSSEAWTVRLMFLLILLFFFPLSLFLSSPSLVSLTCCAGIELLAIKLECVSSQMLGGPSQSILAHSFCSCHSRGRPFSLNYSSPLSHYFLPLLSLLFIIPVFSFLFLSPPYIFPLSLSPPDCLKWY